MIDYTAELKLRAKPKMIMKDFFKIFAEAQYRLRLGNKSKLYCSRLARYLLIVIVSLFAGALLHKCQSGSGGMKEERGCKVDTVTYVDTVKYYAPAPSATNLLGTMTLTVPYTYKKGVGAGGLERQCASVDSTRVHDIITPDSTRTLTLGTGAGGEPRLCDSVQIELPIVQNVYEHEDYTAWVSGVYPRLDSIAVYPKREVVTIKQPPNRWHIGITAGYGYAAKGFQPYIGVGITYSIFSF